MNFKDILWKSKQFTEALTWTVAHWDNTNQSHLAETEQPLSFHSRRLTRTRLTNAGRDAQLTSIVHFSFSRSDTIREYVFENITFYVMNVVYLILNISSGYYCLHLKQLKIGK